HDGSVSALVRVRACQAGWIELEAIEAGGTGACARCDQGQGCGQSLLMRLRRNPEAGLHIRLDGLLNQADWAHAPDVGTLCRLEIAAGSLLKLTGLLYGLPLLGLMAGAGLAILVAGGFAPDVAADQFDLAAAGAGLFGMALGARLVKNLSLQRYCDMRLYPQI